MPYMRKTPPATKKEKDSIFYSGFLKFDMEQEKVVGSIPFGDTKTAGEVYF